MLKNNRLSFITLVVSIFVITQLQAEPVITPLLREPLDVWPEGEVIVTRLDLPARFELASHYHPGAEILYVIEGDTLLHKPGQPDTLVSAGESIRIPAQQVHSATVGAGGIQAVVVRIHIKGQPVRVDVAH